MSGTFVYVIEAQLGVIKVGWSYTPLGRLKTVRTHSPVPVRLYAFWPGTMDDERDIQFRLRAHRTHCEWFRIEGETIDFMREARGRGVEAVEDWASLGSPASEDLRLRKAAARSARMKEVWASPEFRRERAVNSHLQKNIQPLRDLAERGERKLTHEDFVVARANALEALPLALFMPAACRGGAA